MKSNNLNPKDLRTYPVQPKPCKTCPFAGEKALPLAPELYAHYVNNLLNNIQHFCHSANNQMICRGGRIIQLRWLCAMKLLPEPTDECFNAAIDEAMSNNHNKENCHD